MNRYIASAYIRDIRENFEMSDRLAVVLINKRARFRDPTPGVRRNDCQT
jgi:hypothetical protein